MWFSLSSCSSRVLCPYFLLWAGCLWDCISPGIKCPSVLLRPIFMEIFDFVKTLFPIEIRIHSHVYFSSLQAFSEFLYVAFFFFFSLTASKSCVWFCFLQRLCFPRAFPAHTVMFPLVPIQDFPPEGGNCTLLLLLPLGIASLYYQHYIYTVYEHFCLLFS